MGSLIAEIAQRQVEIAIAALIGLLIGKTG
jgi:hypothetical protein